MGFLGSYLDRKPNLRRCKTSKLGMAWHRFLLSVFHERPDDPLVPSQKEPESFNTLKYLHIPADWVLDIANFVSSTSTVAYTRIPSSMDVSPGIATSGGSGLAMRRKYEQEGKRFRWKDSNNTAEDFEKSPPSLKR